MLPDEFATEVPEEAYLKVLRAFFGADPDGDHPSNGLLESLLEAPKFFRHAVAVAFAAGRESAYTEDEWRVNNGGLMWGQSGIRSETERLLAASRDGWLEHRRTGETDWEKVA